MQTLARARNERHVIPYFWRHNKRIQNIASSEYLFPRYRWTVDYPEDVELVSAILKALYRPGVPFRMWEIRQFVDAHPEIARLNVQYLPALTH